MKTRTRFALVLMSVILALAIFVSLAQATNITWWVVDRVDTAGDVGSHTSIAFNSNTGIPWISYYDEENTDLKVAHYANGPSICGQANDWYCKTVDDTGDVGTSSSIDIKNWQQGMVYYDATNGAIKYAYYDLPFWVIHTIKDDTGLGTPSYGHYASMKYSDTGVPQIAYYMSSSMFDDELNYAYKVDSGGNCGEWPYAGWWHCETVDSGEGVGQYVSLDYHTIAGIAYYDGSAGNLKYAQYAGVGEGNCGTADAWQCTIVDGTDGDDVGKFASIHVPANVTDTLQIAYYNATNGTLKYAKRVDGGTGNCAGNTMRCDVIETIGTGLSRAGISLAVDSKNNPIIAYKNSAEQPGSPSLKVAQMATSLGLSYGNCGPLLAWQCTVIDQGSLTQVMADFTSVAFNPDDLAYIAYSEDVYSLSGYEYNLKIAYQANSLALPVVKK